VWLNEGLAKFYDVELLKLVMPEEMDKIERHWQTVRFYAYIVDSQLSTNSLNHYVEDIEEINKKFDQITYYKAACIIQMFQGVVGVETWRKGMHYYLEDNQYSAVEPNDLHKAIQKSLDEDFPGNSLNIDKLIISWEDQAGYPIISVSLENGILKLAQKRHVDDEDLHDNVYNIPITYATSENPNFEDFSTKFWMTEKEIEIKDFKDNWIVFNNQQTGYYKVDYDENLWNPIIDQLHINLSVIHHINREWLFNLRLYRLEADDHDISTTLRFLTYLKYEDNVNVLISMQTLLRKLLEANPDDQAIKAKLKEVLEVVYPRTKDQVNVKTIKQMSHKLGVKIALDDLINEMMTALAHPQKDSESIFCYGLQYANETTVATIMNALRHLNGTELIKSMMHGLACVELFKKVLTILIEKGKEELNIDFYSWISNMETEEKIDVFLTFLEVNYLKLQER